MYKACILDIDGTLLDSVESIAHVGNQLLEHYGYPSLPVENFKHYAGDGGDELVKRILIDSGDRALTHYEEGCKLYRKLFDENPLYHITAFDGMKDTLEKLKAAGAKLGVLSNKQHASAVNVIEHVYGKELFDCIQGQEAGIPRKPSPIGALKIAREFGVSPEECLYVGDTNTDMQTGKSANMMTIGVTWGFRNRQELEENHADRIIDHPSELLALYEES